MTEATRIEAGGPLAREATEVYSILGWRMGSSHSTTIECDDFDPDPPIAGFRRGESREPWNAGRAYAPVCTLANG